MTWMALPGVALSQKVPNAFAKVRCSVVALGAALVTVALSTTDAAADWRHDPQPAGAVGDINNAAICPKGEYIIGFTGRQGDWIDRIAIRCAALLPSGTMDKAGAHTVGGQGGGGGGGNTTECRAGLLTRIHFQSTGGNRIILQIANACVDPISGATTGKVFFGGVRKTGVVEDGDYAQECPDGMGATGLRVRWGRYVNSLGLICNKLKVPEGPSRMLFCQGGGMNVRTGTIKLNVLVDFRAAPQSSTAAIPARGECAWQKTPVAAEEPKTMSMIFTGQTKDLVAAARNGGIFLIHGTVVAGAIRVDKVDSVNVGFVPGPTKPKTLTKPANTGIGAGFAVPGANFDGDWKASADGVGYKITMTQTGTAVSGDFLGDDGSDGHFDGRVSGKNLSFAWKQTDGYGGTGRFTLSGDGGSFSGTYSFGKSAKVSGTWSGRRL